MKTTDGRKRTPQAQQEIRELVIRNLNKGLKNKEIADLLGIAERTVYSIKAAYADKGKRGIIVRKRGRKSEKKLGKREEQQVKKMITDKMPDQLKLPFALWTREAVSLLILNQFGVKVSKWTVGRYLKEWGFSPQKPVYKAYEQKEESVQKWLKEEYPAIQEKAKSEKAMIFWGDETGMRSDHQAGRTYAKKGQTPVIKRTGQRFKANMISAISNRGLLKFMIIKTGFNSGVFIKFMSRMLERADQKIILIVDGHPAHKTHAVKEWLEEHKNLIEVYYLPGYSPELNPDEYLNQDLKTNIVGKKRPRNRKELIQNVKSFLKSRQSDRQKVMNYFHAKHVNYAA